MKKNQAVAADTVFKPQEQEKAEVYFREQVKRPGLLICLYKPEEWGEAESFIRKISEEFPALEVLVYFARGKPEPKPEAQHLMVIDKKDFTLFGNGKKPLKQWLTGHYFDLLLIFAAKENARCKKLAVSVKARLKAGNAITGGVPWADLTLGKAGETMHYEDFYKALKIYFKQLNIRLSQ